VLSLFLGVSLQILWSMIDSLQLITHLPLVRLSMPGNLKLFFSIVNASINLDFLDISPYFPSFLVDSDDSQEPFTDNYEFMGYETTNFFYNSLSFIILLSVYPIFYILSIILGKSCPKLAHRIIRTLRYDYLTRVFMQTYLELCISAFLQVQTLTWSSDSY